MLKRLAIPVLCLLVTAAFVLARPGLGAPIIYRYLSQALDFGQYNSAGVTLTDGQTASLQLDSAGHVLSTVSTAPGVPLAATSALAGTQVQASASCAAAAACSVTLPAVAGKTTYVTSVAITTGPAVAVVIGLATVTGPSSPLNYYVTESVANGAQLLVGYPDALAASAQDTAIVVTLPAVTGGAVSAVTATGFQL